MEKVKILNTYIDNISSSDLLEKIRNGGTLFTQNVDRLVKLQKDADFCIAYNNADYIVCDSKILLLISKVLKNEIKEKISGSDFFPKFYKYYQDDEDIKIFLLGGIEEVAEKARQKINDKVNRSIVVGAYSPSKRFEENEHECQEIVARINSSGATVLAVGLDAPKQEKWIARYKSKLDKVKIFLAIGKTLDFEAETKKRAPKWMREAGLEWLHRLILNPKSFRKRYLIDYIPFFQLIWQQKLGLYVDRPSDRILDRNHSVTKNTRTSKIINVLMFGPCLSEQGGMGTVQKHIINSLKEPVSLKHITTWNGTDNTFNLFFGAITNFIYQLSIGKVDLVHIHMSERGSVLRKSIIASLAFIFSRPVIMHTHGCEFHIFYDNLPPIAKWLLNKVLQNCAYVIVLSKSWKQTYVEKCKLKPEKVLVKYNPVTISSIKVFDRDRADKLTFVLLGKINQRKGVFDVLQAIARLPTDYREKIELIIAGNGEIGKTIALAEELNVDSLISFPGWIDAEQRDLLLQQADVFLLPSYNEGLPMALLEAMSWGLPAITTPVGGVPELVIHNENGLLVEPGNIQDLAASIRALIEDESLRSRLGNAAYQKALDLDVANYSRDILEIYYSALGKNSEERLLQ